MKKHLVKWIALIIVLMGSACSVESFDNVLKKGVWNCESDLDCVEGYECKDKLCVKAGSQDDCKDEDGDGVSVGADCTIPVDQQDCDDQDKDNFPGNTEVCDGKDNNCNDQIDEDIAPLPCPLNTVEGSVCAETKPTYGCVNGKQDPAQCLAGCSNTLGSTECPYGPDFVIEENGQNDMQNPLCDGKDNDCDGTVDTQCPECEEGTPCGLPDPANYLCINIETEEQTNCPCIVDGATLDCSGHQPICRAPDGSIVPSVYDNPEDPNTPDIDENCDGAY